MGWGDLLQGIGGGMLGGVQQYMNFKELEQKQTIADSQNRTRILLQAMNIDDKKERQEFLLKHQKELAGAKDTTTRRGQDMTAATATRGQDTVAQTARRGQDLTSETARRGQDIQEGEFWGGTMPERWSDLMMGDATTRRGQDTTATTARRGQDIGATTARRGQDMTSSTAQRGQDKTSEANLTRYALDEYNRELQRRKVQGDQDLLNPDAPDIPTFEEWVQKTDYPLGESVKRRFGGPAPPAPVTPAPTLGGAPPVPAPTMLGDEVIPQTETVMKPPAMPRPRVPSAAQAPPPVAPFSIPPSQFGSAPAAPPPAALAPPPGVMPPPPMPAAAPPPAPSTAPAAPPQAQAADARAQLAAQVLALAAKIRQTPEGPAKEALKKQAALMKMAVMQMQAPQQ